MAWQPNVNAWAHNMQLVEQHQCEPSCFGLVKGSDNFLFFFLVHIGREDFKHHSGNEIFRNLAKGDKMQQNIWAGVGL